MAEVHQGYTPTVLNFVTRIEPPKSPTQEAVKFLVRHTNKHKLTYEQLKYIFRSTRERCDLRPPKEPQRLLELPTKEELGQFYKSIESPAHRLIFEVLEGTSLRIAELCSLKVERLNFSANSAFVHQGKGSKDRIILFGNRLKEKLQLYLEGKNHRFLFESSRGTKFTTRRIEQLCKQYKEMAGIDKNLTPHTFRHIWNTRLAEAGVPKERRMILAGHSSEKTQEIYTHLGVSAFKEEILLVMDHH